MTLGPPNSVSPSLALVTRCPPRKQMRRGPGACPMFVLIEPELVIMEYEVHGKVVATGVPYDNRFISVITAETPCSPIGMDLPRDVARDMFARVGSRSKQPAGSGSV